MKLEHIEEGMLVVGTEEYQGLGGYIREVERDVENFETENESACEIVVDFIEPADLSVTHPELNGTGVDHVIMGEDELIYFPEGPNQPGTVITGITHQFDDVLLNEAGYKEDVCQPELQIGIRIK